MAPHIKRTITLAVNQVSQQTQAAEQQLATPIFDPNSQSVDEDIRAHMYNTDIRKKRLADAVERLQVLDEQWRAVIEQQEQAAQQSQKDSDKQSLADEQQKYVLVAESGYFLKLDHAREVLAQLAVRIVECNDHYVNHFGQPCPSVSSLSWDDTAQVSSPVAATDKPMDQAATTDQVTTVPQLFSLQQGSVPSPQLCAPSITLMSSPSHITGIPAGGSTPSVVASGSLTSVVPSSGPAAYITTSAAQHVVNPALSSGGPPVVLRPVAGPVYQSRYTTSVSTGYMATTGVGQQPTLHTAYWQPPSTMPPTASQAGYAMPPTASQAGYAMPPTASQAGYAMPPTAPQAGFAMPPTAQPGGYAMPPSTFAPVTGQQPQPYVLQPTNPLLIPPSPVSQYGHVNYPRAAPLSSDGKRGDYQRFINRFMATIGNNPSLHPVQKLDMLLSAMVPGSKAAEALQSINLSEPEFYRALHILNRRYGQVNHTRDHLYQSLQELSKVPYRADKLRSYLDKVESVLANLQELGDNTEDGSPVLLRIIQERLPYEVLERVHLQKPAAARWSMSGFIDILDQLICQLEQLEDLTGKSSVIEKTDQAKQTRPETSKQSRQLRSDQQAAQPSTDLSTTGLFMARSAPRRPQHGEKKKQKSQDSQKKSQAPTHKLSRPCIFCDGQHRDSQCSSYTTMASRRRRLIEKSLCTLCVKPGHLAKNCPETAKRTCFFCKAQGRHYSTICPEKFRDGTTTKTNMVTTNPSETSEAVIQPENRPFIGMMVTGEDAVLSTARVRINNPSDPDKSVVVQALLDGGSQRNFLTYSTAKQLNLDMVPSSLETINSMGGHDVKLDGSMIGSIEVALDDGTSISVTCNTTEVIAVPNQSPCLLKPADRDYLQNYTGDSEPSLLADKVTERTYNFQPQLLIGNGVLPKLYEPSRPIQLPSGLMALPTKFGYVLAGQVEQPTRSTMSALSLTQADGTEFDVDQDYFGSLELLGIEEPTSKSEEDTEAERQFAETVSFDEEENRVVVAWPWRETSDDLHDNHFLAGKSLESLAKKLKVNTDLAKEYTKKIQDQLEAGVIEEAPAEPDGPVYLNPHRAVITPGKSTSVRIVYNPSGKTRKTAKSLNEKLLRGPIRLPLVITMLMMFRLMNVAIASDLQSAFLQVSLRVDQRDVTRFLWFRDTKTFNTAPENIITYRFKRVSFGVVSSPFLLQAAICFHLDRINSEFCHQLKENIYVDNILSGVNSSAEAIDYYAKAKEVFQRASWNLRQFATNCNELRDYIQTVNPCDLAKTTCSVLGITWNSLDDTIKLRGLKQSINPNEPITRKQLFSHEASIYDPLGLAAPLTLSAKLWFQKTWLIEKFGWNRTLPEEFQAWWRHECLHLQSIGTLQYPRKLTPTWPYRNITLHIFVDASPMAYCACAYLRFESEENVKPPLVSVQLLIAKQRLAPTRKHLSLPRLELMACLIGTRLAKFITETVKMDSPLKSVTIWTDSMISLGWLRCTSEKYRIWVSNRTREINDIVNNQEVPICFRYVSTEHNPADIGTRPDTVSVHDLRDENHPWWTGPTFLKFEDGETYNFEPPTMNDEMKDLMTSEMLPIKSYLNTATVKTSWFPVETLVYRLQHSKPSPIRSRTPMVTRLCRVMMIVLQFVVKTFGSVFGRLPAELQYEGFNARFDVIAEQTWPICYHQAIMQQTALFALVLSHQQQQFPKPNLSLWKQLNITKDGFGIYRVEHRLPSAHAPVLLGSTSGLTSAIVLDHHHACGHMSTPTTLAAIRTNGFWVLKGRQTVKKILRECQTCRRNFGGPFKQPPFPSLPDERLQEAPAFSRIGLDYFGPGRVRQGTEVTKVYTLLVTCMISRAVHLELIVDNTAVAFINGFTRFCARRGTPKYIISDNASTFLHAKDIITAHGTIPHEDPTVLCYFAEKMIWRHMIPRASWQNGFIERLVGVAKRALRSIIKPNSVLTWDDYSTIMCQVEAAVNSRPLTYLSSDDTEILRPCDLICNNNGTGFFTLAEIDEEGDEWLPQASAPLLKAWLHRERKLHKFWKIWQSSYLESLRETAIADHRTPRSSIHSVPQIDQKVLVHEDTLKRGQWKVGVIVNTLTSADGQIRGCRVRLSNGSEIERPVSKLYPFEMLAINRSTVPDEPADPGQPASIVLPSAAPVCEPYKAGTLKSATEPVEGETSEPTTPLRRSARLRLKQNLLTVLVILLVTFVQPGAASIYGKSTVAQSWPWPFIPLMYYMVLPSSNSTSSRKPAQSRKHDDEKTKKTRKPVRSDKPQNGPTAKLFQHALKQSGITVRDPSQRRQRGFSSPVQSFPSSSTNADAGQLLKKSAQSITKWTTTFHEEIQLDMEDRLLLQLDRNKKLMNRRVDPLQEIHRISQDQTNIKCPYSGSRCPVSSCYTTLELHCLEHHRQPHAYLKQKLESVRDKMRARLRSEPRPKVGLTIWLTLAITIITTLPGVAGQCEQPMTSLVSPVIVFVEECQPIGRVIYRHPLYGFCSQLTTCHGHTSIAADGRCNSLCSKCPTNHQCIWPPGDVGMPFPNASHLLQSVKPTEVCSYQPSSNCSHNQVERQLNTISLRDGSVHYVNSMSIKIEDKEDHKFSCLMNGRKGEVELMKFDQLNRAQQSSEQLSYKFGGTIDFCTHHVCSSSANVYCFRKHHHKAFFTIDDSNNIPIQTWGLSTRQFYEFKSVHSCNTISSKCAPGGIIVTATDEVDTIHICATPPGGSCYQKQLAKTNKLERTSYLPLTLELAIISHEVNLTYWNNGLSCKQEKLNCPAVDYCELINCQLCTAAWSNPQCITWPLWIALFSGTVITTTLILAATELIGKRCQPHFVLQTWLRNLLKCSKASSHVMGDSTNPDDFPREEEIELTHLPTRLTYRSQPLLRQSLSPTLLIVIAILAHPVIAKHQQVHLLSASRDCTRQNRELNCSISQSARLNLNLGEVSTIVITDDDDTPLGKVTLKLTDVWVRCNKQSLYWSRSMDYKVSSIKRCAFMGSCRADRCEKLTTDSIIPELEDQSTSTLGFSYCMESCGCLGCGCGLCSAGCLFYRLNAIPTSSPVYEVFRCPTWKYEFKFEVSTQSTEDVTTRRYTLSPGSPTEGTDIKLSLISATEPALPILQSNFVTDGLRTIMTTTSPAGMPLSGELGMLQCPNRTSAESTNLTNCFLAPDNCQCQGRQSSVSCACPHMNIDDLFIQSETVLPINSGAISLQHEDNSVIGRFQQEIYVEAQMDMEHVRMQFLTNNNNCDIRMVRMEGSYDSLTGAATTVHCRSSNSYTIAHVSCGHNTFTVPCSSTGIETTVMLHFNQRIVDEVCSVKCALESTFRLSATLAYVQHTQLTAYGTVQSIVNESPSRGFDWSSLGSVFQTEWLQTMLTIIAAVTCAIIGLFAFGTLLQCLLSCRAAVSQLTATRRL